MWQHFSGQSFIDDPSEIIRALEASWEEYLQRDHEIIAAIEASVVTTRIAAERYEPDHPFWMAIDTTMEFCGPWRARPVRWVDTVKEAYARHEHGFDQQGRLVMSRGPHWSQFMNYGDGYYDILRATNPKERGQWTILQTDSDGFRGGRFERIVTDPDGRMVGKLSFYHEHADPESHDRWLEVFAWRAGRLVESFRQSFDRGAKLPPWAKEVKATQESDMYRRVNEHLREGVRTHIVYTYGSNGALKKAEKIYVNSPVGAREVLYAHNSSDTIDKVSRRLVKLLTKAVVKAVKNAKAAWPVGRVALVYSAEHVSGVFPRQVLLAPPIDDEHHPLDWEAFPHEADWPPSGWTGSRFASLCVRLVNLVESGAAVDGRPYREVLWKACRAAYDKLARKRFTTDDFVIFPLDDHGDVDALEDIRESMPEDAARRLTRYLSDES